MMLHLRTWSFALLLLPLLAFSGTLASPTAAAAPPHPVVYDALGDSYASGYGVPPYGPCGRSASAYPEQLNGRQQIKLDNFVACAGATTTSLVTDGQLNALNADTDLVTLTIGGNDIGWSGAVGACLGGTDAQCAGAIAKARERITTQLPGLLRTVYDQVAAAAPNAHVAVTGYPELFSPENGAYLGASPAEQVALNDGADLLNDTIAGVAAKTRPVFQFVDVTPRFVGHGVNAPDAWILPPSDPAAFHPNINGYKAYTAAVNSALGPVKLG
ncbi:SGNH/GDSL hydrolase family protein [Aldersonia sp. NBC_00410]|uniref:SGNH/GDSL hydrolase family protein n=1 Tax=Aldersonia sp. NBC_00410 TaxID=2975954 RepID=UPI00225583AF|nr:SGNH/GDSL hydrolase family protein [Aldersonia sp. NBC_00410]MCX5046343.1 SGNH/GDSL hydrolase family protein [Aldersonia sp. NBC_00410]